MLRQTVDKDVKMGKTTSPRVSVTKFSNLRKTPIKIMALLLRLSLTSVATRQKLELEQQSASGLNL